MRTLPWQSAVAAIVAVISCGLISEVAADADCTIVEVTDKKGARLAKAEIVASYHKYDNLVFRTDRNGQVCIRNRGRATLHITPPQLPADSCLYEGEDEHFPLDPAAGRRQRFQIERRTRMLPRAPLHGQIVSPSGNPVAGARVYVYSLVVETKDRTCSLRDDDETHSAKDGSFTLPAIPHGLIELWVEGQGYAAKRFEVRTPGPSVKIVLDQGATFRGRVLAPDGVAIESCEVWLEFDPHSLHNATCTPQGFLLKYLSPGDAKLRVDIKAGSVLGLRSLSKKVHIEPNQQLQEDIRWPAGETIAGEVVTAAGDPVSGIWIHALPRGTENLLNRIHPDSVRVQTDAYGRFTFWHLPPGSWVLSFYGIETTQEARTGDIDVRLVKRMN